MFRLDNLLEQWAQLYRPLSHTPGAKSDHRTFFRIAMIDQNSEFVRNFTTTPSPAMAYATHIDAELAAQNPKAISYRHVIYFMVKQQAGTLSKTQATDELSATEARFLCDDLVQDLIALLFTLKGMAGGKSLPKDEYQSLPLDLIAWLRNTADNPEYREGLRGLQLDQAHWGTLPVMLNGWQICGLTIEQITPRRLCLTPSRYNI